jgi:peptidoglycan hydrolase CwlO-like protein
LRELARKAGVKTFSTLISRGTRLDLRGKEPDAEYETMLRVLRFDDDLVRDQLIIHHSIEQVLLLPDRRKAEAILWDKKPHGLRFAYCRHETKKDEFHALHQGRRIDPCKGARDWRPRLRTDDVAQARHLEEKLADQQAELRELQNQVQEAAKELKDAGAALAARQREEKSFETKLRHANALVTSIEGEMDQFENDDTKLHMLKDQLTQAEGRCSHELGQLVNMKDTIGRVNKKVEALRAEKREESLRVKQCWKTVEEAQGKVRKCSGTAARQRTQQCGRGGRFGQD